MNNDLHYVVIATRNRYCRVLEMLKENGINNFKINEVRLLKNGLVAHLVEIPGEISEAEMHDKLKWKRMRSYYCIESEGCELCKSLLSSKAFLVSGRMVEHEKFVYSFIVPGATAFQKLIKIFEKRGDFEILKTKKLKPKPGVLTRRQENVLWIALKSGFFDYPRRVNITQLSSMLGVSPSTLSEIMRRGLKRILEFYYEESSH